MKASLLHPTLFCRSCGGKDGRTNLGAIQCLDCKSSGKALK